MHGVGRTDEQVLAALGLTTGLVRGLLAEEFARIQAQRSAAG